MLIITVVGCCTYTQSNSFIHFAKWCIVSSCIISISNQCAYHNSVGGCCNLVLSWSHGRRRNKWTLSFVSPSRSSIVSRFGLSVILGLCSSGHFPAIKSDCLSLNTFNRDQTRNSQSLLQLFIHLCMGRYTLSLYLPLDGSPRFT